MVDESQPIKTLVKISNSGQLGTTATSSWMTKRARTIRTPTQYITTQTNMLGWVATTEHCGLLYSKLVVVQLMMSLSFISDVTSFISMQRVPNNVWCVRRSSTARNSRLIVINNNKYKNIITYCYILLRVITYDCQMIKLSRRIVVLIRRELTYLLHRVCTIRDTVVTNSIKELRPIVLHSIHQWFSTSESQLNNMDRVSYNVGSL